MNWINRLPISAWFLITLVLCYAVWNPTSFSLWYFWTESSSHLSLKALIGAAALGICIMYFHETWRSLGYIGLAIFAAIIAATLWLFYDLGLLRADNIYTAKYWAQIPLALLLTIGFQGGRMYRSLTGRVPVAMDTAGDYASGHHDDAAIDHVHHN